MYLVPLYLLRYRRTAYITLCTKQARSFLLCLQLCVHSADCGRQVGEQPPLPGRAW